MIQEQDGTPLQELLNVSQDDSNQCSKYEQIEETPFTIVTDEKGTFIAVGNYRVTEHMTEMEARSKVHHKDWDLIGAWVTLVTQKAMEAMNEELKELNKQENEN